MQKSLGQNPQTNITLDKTTGVVCTCGSNLFKEAVIIRKASKFLTGTQQDAIIPIPVFACLKCNEVPEEFLPQELKDKLK